MNAQQLGIQAKAKTGGNTMRYPTPYDLKLALLQVITEQYPSYVPIVHGLGLLEPGGLDYWRRTGYSAQAICRKALGQPERVSA
jgi:hypothetical protein